MHELRDDQRVATMGIGGGSWFGTHQIRVSTVRLVPRSLIRTSTILRYENGINTFDTADIYSNGDSERILGKALKEHKIPRENVVIMTKARFPTKRRMYYILTSIYAGVLRDSGRWRPTSYGRGGRSWLRQPPWALSQGQPISKLKTRGPETEEPQAHLRLGQGELETAGCRVHRRFAVSQVEFYSHGF
jgi:hypothetical protein